jgi:hypothetical protein
MHQIVGLDLLSLTAVAEYEVFLQDGFGGLVKNISHNYSNKVKENYDLTCCFV